MENEMIGCNCGNVEVGIEAATTLETNNQVAICDYETRGTFPVALDLLNPSRGFALVW